jgi:hypothetical protein
VNVCKNDRGSCLFGEAFVLAHVSVVSRLSRLATHLTIPIARVDFWF